MDRQNIDNRLQQIKVNNRYITKGFKYSIIAIAIGFVTVIALFMIMMVWGIISNVEVIPEEVSNVWFGVAVLYTTLFAPFCIITAIISVIVQMSKGTKQIIDIVRAGLNMRLLQPMILINTKSLAQFNSFEVPIYLCVSNIKTV